MNSIVVAVGHIMAPLCPSVDIVTEGLSVADIRLKTVLKLYKYNQPRRMQKLNFSLVQYVRMRIQCETICAL